MPVLPAWLPWIGGLLFFELAADVVAKESAIHGTWWRMGFAVCLVIAANLCWQFMLRTGIEISRGGVMFAVGVALGVLVIGVVGYHEPITPKQMIGAGFGVVAVALLAG